MRSSLVAMLLLVAGCGPGVHDLSVSSAPILTVKGKVDLAGLKRVNADAPLIAALVWVGKAQISPICIKYLGDPKLKDVCQDPYGVFLGDFENSVALDPAGDGSFELTLGRLPYAKASVGDAENRIAYGTLILVEDSNGDGRVTIGADLDMPPFPGEEPPKLDQIVAASFYNLKSPQQRLVFREGEFDTGSYFYPVPECATPPPGFSVLRTQGMGVADGCTIVGVEEAIVLQAIVGVDDRLACRISHLEAENFAFVIEPIPEMGEPVDAVCIDAETLMEVQPRSDGCSAPVFTVLKGCWNDPYCPEPQWDYTANKPEWWPC